MIGEALGFPGGLHESASLAKGRPAWASNRPTGLADNRFARTTSASGGFGQLG